MVDTFNMTIRSLANRLAYGAEIEVTTPHVVGDAPMLIVAAKMYLQWVDEMPEPVIRTAPETASGEFTAR